MTKNTTIKFGEAELPVVGAVVITEAGEVHEFTSTRAAEIFHGWMGGRVFPVVSFGGRLSMWRP